MNARFLMFNFLYFALHLHCTLSINSVEKIINGVDSNIKLVPYTLSMMLNNKYVCTAAIINHKWAVTAAHCVEAAINPRKEMSVCSGSSIFYEHCIIHYIVDFSIHEHYNNMTNDYDIAVIKVTPEFTYNSYTKPVDLAPHNAKNVFKEWGTVCGWGYYLKVHDKIDPLLSKNMKCITIPKIEKKLCREDYEHRYPITDQMICYGYQNGFKDACQGDSGAALVNKDNILLGVTSWGAGCGKMFSPGVYTDAIALRDWIKDKTNLNTSPATRNIATILQILLKYFYNVLCCMD